MTRPQATSLIHAEQDYAQSVHGSDQHSPLEWLSMIRAYADRAISAATFDHGPAAADEMGRTLRIIGGLAITAIEQHGAPSRIDEQDITHPQFRP